MTRGSLFFKMGLGLGEGVAVGVADGFGDAVGVGLGSGFWLHPTNDVAIVPAVREAQASTVRREAWPEDLVGRLSTDRLLTCSSTMQRLKNYQRKMSGS